MGNDKFDRVKLLVGQDDFEKLKSAKVLLLGVGGVGGYCLDALYRTGVTNITIVDFDKFDVTNQNRQIGSEFIGEYKVDVMKRLYPNINIINAKIDKEFVDSFDFKPYDIVADAIDDIPAKVAIALKCHKKLISSMGGAKKMDPTKIEVTNIWKTHSDPLARKFRSELKKLNFKYKFNVIFSPEEPICSTLGSFVGVTGSFGLAFSASIIKKILKKN